MSPADVWPVATFLREEMDARGWTIEQMAENAGLTVSAIQDVLDGEMLPAHVAKGIGDAFGASSEYWQNLDYMFWQALYEAFNTGQEEQP